MNHQNTIGSGAKRSTNLFSFKYIKMKLFWSLVFCVFICSIFVEGMETAEKGAKSEVNTHNSTMELVQPVMAAAAVAFGKKMNLPGFEQTYNTPNTGQPLYSGVLQNGAHSNFQTNVRPPPNNSTLQFQSPPSTPPMLNPVAMLTPQQPPYHPPYDPQFPYYVDSYLDTSQNLSNDIPIAYPPPYAEPYTSSQYSGQSFAPPPTPTNSTYPPLQYSGQLYSSEADPKAAEKLAKKQNKERKEKEKGHKEGKDEKTKEEKEAKKEKKNKNKLKKDKYNYAS